MRQRWRARGRRVGALFAVVAATLARSNGAGAAEPVPVNVQTAPGRFEIAALDPSDAHRVAAAAEEAWRWLAGPLGLPDAFSSPIYVRITPDPASGDPAAFHVLVEPGGIVSVRLFARGLTGPSARRAIVQGLLLRLGVARQGVHERLNAPLWLEQACVGWWQTHAEAAQLDAVKQECERLAPPPLGTLLNWQRGGDEPRALSLGALWLLTFFQNESVRGREWAALLPRLLGGEEPFAAIATAFPDRFGNAAERELWWQTGYHHAVRVRALPMLEPGDSQTQLAAVARFVFLAPAGEVDAVVPLREVLARASEPVVGSELARRVSELERLMPTLHPFYRNAGLSLAEALRRGPNEPKRRDALCTAFESDWRDAVELQRASTAALDALTAAPR